MAMQDAVVYSYNDTFQGQIAVGTVTSPWIRTDQGPRDSFSELTLKGAFTTGTTVTTVDESLDGVNVAYSTADLQAGLVTPVGAVVKVAAPWCRVKIVQSVATTTVAKLAVKASD